MQRLAKTEFSATEPRKPVVATHTAKQSIALKLKSYSNKLSEVSKDKKAVEWAMNLIEIYSITSVCHAMHLGMVDFCLGQATRTFASSF